eukprot:CAMPEP_0194392408 /NCGR_PEP_ID=MMETSP0174-20130528/121681_1 /TAXON_ID=216777 /ORGANISM="Proboscia alata, Strain PI-D3" /LENGTH=590 /DNA_ID=CAMNT_0039187779 /DNA_START=39 /DNA_END=1811 /DNA_ORIENTATION=+
MKPNILLSNIQRRILVPSSGAALVATIAAACAAGSVSIEKDSPTEKRNAKNSSIIKYDGPRLDHRKSFCYGIDEILELRSIAEETKDSDVNKSSVLTDISESLFSFLSDIDQGDDDHFQTVIEKAREDATQTDERSVREKSSFIDLALLLHSKVSKVNEILNTNFASLNNAATLNYLNPTSLWYYLEREDELKNPSWKRRKHRYYPTVDVTKLEELNDALYLSELSYENSVEEIREGLKKFGSVDPSSQRNNTIRGQWELIFCTIDSLPEKPSHYVAVKRDTSKSIFGSTSTLQVLLVVRGTKSVEDVITNVLMEAVEYRDGEAHAGIVRAGKYLVEKHKPLLESLLANGRQTKIDLLCIGHSLGAGAASIAAIELMEDDDGTQQTSNIDVNVIGFGCPALLSDELSLKTKPYITTIIGDADLVPRMSCNTLGNLALDVMQYDYNDKAKRDVKQALEELLPSYSKGLTSTTFLSKASMDKAKELVDSMMKKMVSDAPPDASKDGKTAAVIKERMKPELFPPGECIHFYRDGYGISGSYTPCAFFNEIDVTRTMVEDHYIDTGYRRLFLELMRQYHNDQQFSFEKRNVSAK